jgi:hypothetical protein
MKNSTAKDTIEGSEPRTAAKVAPAQKLITKPRDLIAAVEGRHVAVLALSFTEKRFSEDDGATPVCTVAVVDVEEQPLRPVAVLEITWRRVVPALRLTEPGTWTIGRLQREEESNAVELLPPDEKFDLEQAAVALGEQMQSQRDQRALSTETGAGFDDDVPFMPTVLGRWV